MKAAIRKMKAAEKAGHPGLVEQYRQLVQDIKAELEGLPGYTAGLAADVIADLGSIGPAVTAAMGFGEDGHATPMGGGKRHKRRHHKGRATGGDIPPDTIQRVGERGPEWVVTGSRSAHVLAGGGRREPIAVYIDGRMLFEIMDARNGRAIAMGG
jgi:SLT domain-containing protein